MDHPQLLLSEVLSIEPYCRWLSRYFFVAGMDADDLFQEAWLAAWLAPGHERIAARRRILDLLKFSQRRPQLVIWDETAAPWSDQMDARERLHEILSLDLSELERMALGRRIRGEGNTDKRLDNAWVRVRAKIAA